LIKRLTSKKGVSPILATLLLIAIVVAAVVITFAWVTTFMSTQTRQSGAILALENVRFYGSPTTAKNRTDITIMNTGTASARIASIYWSDSSFLDLQKLTLSEHNATNTVVSVGSSVTITVEWGVSGGTILGNWTSQTTYYFKVVTDAGHQLPFAEKSP